MGRVSVRPFEREDLEECAAMFAAQHRENRKRFPMFRREFESASDYAAVLARAASNPRVSSAVAERDGRLVGFVFAEEMLFPPDHFASQYVPPESADIAVDGHAVAPGEDATEVYRAMYAELGEQLVRRGLFTHRVHIVPDAEVQEAWVSLGFGRHLTAATRPTADPVVATNGNIEVHQASTEDIDVVMRLADSLNRHHLRAPIFWPILPAPQPAAREYNLAQLADPDASPYFVAYVDGQPVAMQTFNTPGFLPSVVDQESNIYLYEGVVDDGARSGGSVPRCWSGRCVTCVRRESGGARCTTRAATRTGRRSGQSTASSRLSTKWSAASTSGWRGPGGERRLLLRRGAERDDAGEVVRDTGAVLAFKHTRPHWRVHIVVVPKRHVPSLVDVADMPEGLIVELLDVVRDVAGERERERGGAHIVTNVGKYQESKHLHFHVGAD